MAKLTIQSTSKLAFDEVYESLVRTIGAECSTRWDLGAMWNVPSSIMIDNIIEDLPNYPVEVDLSIEFSYSVDVPSDGESPGVKA